MQLSRRNWQGIALGLGALAILCSGIGILFALSPARPTEEIIDPLATNWQVSRGCFFGPAFALLFLAYIAFLASRRRNKTLHAYEIITSLGIVLGLILLLFGLAIVITPAENDTIDTLFGIIALCIMPGLAIMTSAIIFWFLSRARKT